MTWLVLGLVIFLGAHSVRIVGEDWRAKQIARRGENGWKGLYSLVSIVGFVLIVWGYGQARLAGADLWHPPVWTRHTALLLTLVSFVLLAAAYVPGTRIKAAIKHPMVVGVKVWAFAHLISNGRLADMRVESYTVRDRMRLACTVSLVYSTTAEQMRTVLSGLERVLRAHPKIWPDAVVVRFKELAASSLDIEIMAWFETRDWGEFQLIRQEILLQMMSVVERAGTSIAFPTRTLHLASAEPGPNQPGLEALARP